MIKVLFVLENLAGGGAEKVVVNLVNNIDKSKFDITVMTLFDEGVNAKKISADVKLISKHFGKIKGMRFLFRFLPEKLLYKYYVGDDNYDVVVAYMTGIPTMVVAGAKTKRIAWIHGEYFEERKLYNFGLKHCYNKFNAVVGVCDYVSESFNKSIKSKIKAVTVYNTNDTESIISLSDDETEFSGMPNGLKIVSVGRLCKEKRFDRLINAVIKLKNENYDVSLTIVGDGILMNELSRQIVESDSRDYIKLVGFKSNPYPYVKNADLFVCSSFTEGLSTAVTEAIILGKPVVSTDVSGAKEILGYSNEYGIVTDNNENALYEGIKKMISIHGLLEYYGKKAKERAEFFSTKKTVKQTEDLFLSVSK